MDNALVIKDLKKSYSNGAVALKGVSLEVKVGDFFALLGPNGAGKTTLIGIVSQLVTKSSGSVRVFDADIDTLDERAKTYIGLVPQEVNFSIFEKPIDIVVNQAGYYGIPRDKALKDAEIFLKQLDLWDKKDQPSRVLSGGMKRRLLIARALIHHPKLLILDEPTAGVDIELRRGMWDFLNTLIKEGVTIILTTHYLEEAEQLCNKVAIINKGEIIESGTMQSVLGTLKKEMFVLNVKHPIHADKLEKLKAYHPKKMDERTLEVDLEAHLTINALLADLTESGIEVTSMRNKSNRLEEVFVNLISQSA